MTEGLPFKDRNGGSGPEALDFSTRLNPAQYEAVTTVDGPILVVAGAGSGKTRTLVHRVAYLVGLGVPPESILLLTFTRKAAQEMLSRAQALVGERCARVAGGTFHALAHELLRRWASRLGYPASFGVLDRGDMEELLGQLRKSLDLGKNDRGFPKRATLAAIISKAANKDEGIGPLLDREYVHLSKYAADIRALAAQYAEYKRKSALLDFDDLLIQLVRLLSEDEEARAIIAGGYRYIMVDEYQDTNPLQAAIVRHLGRDHQNVMVVGDDAQSIYSFRGATFRNIMDFPSQFPGARLIRLEENYRSRQPILDLTNHIISKAREKYDKKLFTRREGGRPPRLVLFSSQKEQSLYVCRRVREHLDQGLDPREMAVLFRAASHSFDLELELTRHGLGYIKYGGRRFLEAAHIKDLLSLLRVAAHPGDRLSLTRCLLLLEGIGPRTAARIADFVAGSRDRLTSLADAPVQDKHKEILAPLSALMSRIAVRGAGLQDRIELAWAFYRPCFQAKFDDYPRRLADLNEFLRLAQDYTSLTRFLADMTLEPPNASAPGEVGPDGRGRLVLSTVHSAKGLEWKVVFILWAAEGRFPAAYALNNPEELDEERRLMYVAATRAADELYLLCPLEEEYRGDHTRAPKLSRFLAGTPPTLLTFDAEEGEPSGPVIPPRPAPSGRVFPPPIKRPGRRENLAPPPSPAAGFSPGQRVSHPVFGLGRVTRVLDDRKIKIDFDHFGSKTLHLDFAGLKPAG
ncbi:MAG: UvrD-helicase domain-containing protein [Thermodesulfobacteriota bacterium]